MSDCKEYREEIEELAGVGRLSAGARAHVNACASCRGLEEERASRRRLVRGLERVEAPSDFEFRLRARIKAARGGHGRWPLRPAYGFAALAASALFLSVSASLYVTQERQAKPGAGRHEALTAAGDSRPARENDAAQTVDAGAAKTGDAGADTFTNTASLGGQTPKVVQGAQYRVRTHAAFAQRAGDVAQSVPPVVAGAKNSLNEAFRTAQVIERSPTLTVPVDTSAAPLRVVLRDESGAQRVVPMRSVSFGAQELIAREGQTRRAPAADKEGVW